MAAGKLSITARSGRSALEPITVIRRFKSRSRNHSRKRASGCKHQPLRGLLQIGPGFICGLIPPYCDRAEQIREGWA